MLINIKNGDHTGGVLLEINLRDYCLLSKILYDNIENKEFSASILEKDIQNIILSTTTPDNIRDEDRSAMSCGRGFELLRKDMENSICLSLACELWEQIESTARAQIEAADDQRLLSGFSQDPYCFRAVKSAFREIIKNSSDAIISSFLDGKRETSDLTLKMNINFKITHKKFYIILEDNGSGFPNEFISHYQTPADKISEWTSKNDPKKRHFLLGGAGQGLKMLRDSVHEQDGDVVVANTPKGAQITVTSPRTPKPSSFFSPYSLSKCTLQLPQKRLHHVDHPTIKPVV